MGYIGQRRRSPEIIDILLHVPDPDILGLSRLHIGADHIEFHGILQERFIIIGIQHLRNLMVAEFDPDKFPVPQPVLPAHKPPVPGILLIISNASPNLAGGKGCTDAPAGGDAHESVKGNPVLHHHIQGAGRIQSAHAAALQYQSCLFRHFYRLSCLIPLYCKRLPRDQYPAAL